MSCLLYVRNVYLKQLKLKITNLLQALCIFSVGLP